MYTCLKLVLYFALGGVTHCKLYVFLPHTEELQHRQYDAVCVWLRSYCLCACACLNKTRNKRIHKTGFPLLAHWCISNRYKVIHLPCFAHLFPTHIGSDSNILISTLSPTILPSLLSRCAGCMPPNTSVCCYVRAWSSSAAGAWSCWSHSSTTTVRLCPWRLWTSWTRPARTR